MTTQQTQRFVELLNWLVEHPRYCANLCHDDVPMPTGDLLALLEVLESRGYYEFIPLILEKNKINRPVHQAMTRFFLGKLTEELTTKGFQASFQELKALLTAELEQEYQSGRASRQAD